MLKVLGNKALLFFSLITFGSHHYMDMDAYQPIKVRHEIEGSVLLFFKLSVIYRTVLVRFFGKKQCTYWRRVLKQVLLQHRY